MKIIDSGTFQLSPGEFVTVSIQKAFAPYQATVDLIGVPWSVPPEPTGLGARGGFVGPDASGRASMTIFFDFIPSADGSHPPGDRYDVVIQGLPNEDRRIMTVFAGGAQARSFLFRS